MLINFDVEKNDFVLVRHDPVKRRWYYALGAPLVMLRLDGFSIDEIRYGEWCDGLVGWDSGVAGYVLPDRVGLLHTKVTLKSHGIKPFLRDLPPGAKMMHEIIAFAPGMDEKGR